MKIVFMDIDGVLNFHNSARLAESCMAVARHIADETGAKFVLTSSWRDSVLFPEHWHDSDKRFIDTLMNHMGLPFIGVTPYIDEDLREVEIQEWLDSTSEEIESFVIIDDLDFGFPENFPDNFVKTSGFSARGLTEENAEKAIRILNDENFQLRSVIKR